MDDISPPACIYCDGSGPFTAEHVIPASIGADDSDWLLKDCVCQSCNTGVFSPLEQRFARSSPFYLSRLALQPIARKRGSKTEPPKAQLQESLYFDPGIDLVLEAIITGGSAGLTPVSLPQIHLLRHQGGMAFSVIAPDAPVLTKLLGDLTQALGQQATMIEKDTGAAGDRYTIHQLKRVSGRYQIFTSMKADRPQAGAIWYASLAPVRSYAASNRGQVSPRIFRHESGSLTCRADDIDRALAVLTAVADEIGGWTVPSGTPTLSTPTPAIRQTLVYDHTAYCRVLAKIGLNIIAKTSGLDVIRQARFERAKNYVMRGRPLLVMKLVGDEDIPGAILPLADSHHLIGIQVERCLGMEVVRAVFKLYGGPVQRIRLAARCGGSLGVSPVWLSVDYVNHKVKRHVA